MIGVAIADLVQHRELHTGIDHLLEVLDAVVAHADTSYEPRLLRLEHRAPAVRAALGPADGRVQKVEVDIPETTCIERLAERRLGRGVPAVVLELRRIEDVGTRRPRGGAEVGDRSPDLPLVVVPLGAILQKIERGEKRRLSLPSSGPGYGLGRERKSAYYVPVACLHGCSGHEQFDSLRNPTGGTRLKGPLDGIVRLPALHLVRSCGADR